MKKLSVLVIAIALVVVLTLRVGTSRSAVAYSQGSDIQSSSFSDFVAELLGIVKDLTVGTNCTYDAKDDQGVGLDTIKIIENLDGGYLGICHHSMGAGGYDVRLANSSDLLHWTYIRTIESGTTSQPTLARVPNGAYIIAFESEEGGNSSHLRFHYYANLSALLDPSYPLDATYNATRFNSQNQHEGTPNFYNVTITDSMISACVGFHYDNGSVDNVAAGSLWLLLGDPKNTSAWVWNNTRPLTGYNQGLRDTYQVQGNIGDRDYGLLFGRNFTLQEANFQPRPTDYSKWQIFLFDHLKGAFVLVNITTHNGSTSFGNPTFTFLKSPSGKDAVVVTYYLFTEGAGTGEAGELIFYKEFSQTTKNVSSPETTYPVEIYSNSTVLNVTYDWSQKRVDINVTGSITTKGYCLVLLPTGLVQELWFGNFTVLFDGKSYPSETWNDSTNTYVYVTYTHPEHVVTIIPELNAALFMSLFMATTILTIALSKKRVR